MSYEDLAKRKVAEELRRFVLMRGGADTLDTVWDKEAETIFNMTKKEITIVLTIHPNTPNDFSSGRPMIDSIKYEIPFQDILARISESERNGYKPTRIELQMRANLGNIYGLPAKLKLIE